MAEFWKEDANGLEKLKTIKLLNVTDYKKNFAEETPKLILSVELDPIGIINVPEAQLKITR